MSYAGIKGRVAVVTAGGAGIGRAIVDLWAAEGGHVAVIDKETAAAQEAASAARKCGVKAMAITLDVTDVEAIRKMVPAVVAELGGIDALFNVAGTNLFKDVEESEEEDWTLILDTNVKSVARCSKYIIPEMRRRGGGAIINVASIMGVLAGPKDAAYSTSKGAVIQLTRSMGADFAKDNIRTNAICPGFTLTPRARGYLKALPDEQKKLGDLSPMKRMAEPEEMAHPAVFLASDGASYINGTTLVVDGGITASNSGFPVPGGKPK
jgi:NAD(P)-dependent dehydrogenase (short-subunit alcohol dehydrogenase family)